MIDFIERNYAVACPVAIGFCIALAALLCIAYVASYYI